MASDNLNRVFIKAYGKGKPSSGDTTHPAATGEQSDAWIVRFDTATVQSAIVPQMHNQRPPRHEAALVQPTRSPTPKQSPQKRSLSAALPRDLEINSGTASQSIDSPMLTSDTSLSGLHHLPSETDLAAYLGANTMLVAPANFGPKAQAGNESRRDENRTARPIVPLRSEDTLNAPQPISRQGTTQNEVPATPQFSANRGQRSQPTMPSVGKYDETNELAQPRSIDPLELEQQIAAKNRSGEIFRLDRPSYATTQHPLDVFADEQASSPSEQSSMTAQNIMQEMEGSGESLQSVSIQGPSRSRSHRASDSVSSQTPVQNEQAKAKERDLRSARVRIFNPLWEVDRLEWPRVCLELLDAIDSKSPGIANNLLNACQEGLQVLAVTSPQSGAGTSTVACCLAMIAGRHGLKIALVDGNMENPSLCYQTNLELEVDWHEAVARKLPLEEIAVHSVDDQVTLVPLLARLSAPQLNEQNIAKMLSELSQSFDLVVVDVGHMASSRNMVTALGDMGAINAVVAVVDRRNNSAERIESCLRQIRQTGIASIGLVENFAA